MRLPEQHLRKWFISCLEQRNFTLHNQSVKEHRMARVLEARDCMGFNFSQFLSSPSTFMKMKAVFQDGSKYPELLHKLLLFNLDPKKRIINIIRALLDENLRQKVVFVNQADWNGCICAEGGLSPAVLPEWAQHVDIHSSSKGWTWLKPQYSMHTCAKSLHAGQACEWQVHCGSRFEDARSVRVRVTAYFIDQSAKPPCIQICHPAQDVSADTSLHRSSLTATSDGILLVEANLLGSAAVPITIRFSIEGQVSEPIPDQLQLAPSAHYKPIDKQKPMCAFYVSFFLIVLSWLVMHSFF